MDLSQIVAEYRKRGYYTNSTLAEIHDDIAKMQYETKIADKRTYNGRMTRIFNNARIAIAKLFIADIEQQKQN